MSGWAAAAGLEIAGTREFPSQDNENGLTVCLWRLSDKT